MTEISISIVEKSHQFTVCSTLTKEELTAKVESAVSKLAKNIYTHVDYRGDGVFIISCKYIGEEDAVNEVQYLKDILLTGIHPLERLTSTYVTFTKNVNALPKNKSVNELAVKLFSAFEAAVKEKIYHTKDRPSQFKADYAYTYKMNGTNTIGEQWFEVCIEIKHKARYLPFIEEKLLAFITQPIDGFRCG